MTIPTRPQGRWRCGIATLTETPIPQVAIRAGAWEALGFDDIWVPDERLTRNVYITLATVAQATSQVGLGPAVTNPYTRHPAITAAAIATVDEISGGRASLAFGAGGGLDVYGLERTRPAATLKEAVRVVQGLTAGERLTYQGEVFSLHDAGLDFQPVRPVPVYLAGRGPRLLETAGEVADGAIIGGFATAAGLGYALERIDQGVQQAGRATRPDVMAWLYLSVHDDATAARVAVSHMVLASLITSRPILDRLGLRLPARLKDHLDATGWRYPTETPAQAAELLPDELVEAFAVYGTPADCLGRLDAIGQLGLNHVAFVPFPAGEDTLDQAARRAAALLTDLQH
ncbi:MAG: LLM class flavin-dependent oxidoreductase [Bifidobacteriaceae bacterium]|jgi:5,10-methylenetetrahydromethanopterin reductase|nr:LLM class flavin-dependent oxidoreductase [Bifidobacteriaceae bacterium]